MTIDLQTLATDRRARGRRRAGGGAALAACALAVLALAGCGSADGAAPSAATGAPARYTVPGERAFPEGIGVQKSSGDLFVGSTTDGTIYRGNVARGSLEPFLPGGRDGRTAATGVKVDPRGRLFVAGRFTGRLFVYDVASRRLIRRLDVPAGGRTFSPRAEPSLVNDLTFTGDAAYVTDSFRPVIYRVSLAGDRVGALEPWLDLTDTPVRYRRGFNLNGISASDDGRYLVTVHTETGELFRVDTRTKDVRPIDLGGTRLITGDGLLLDGRTLFAVREDPAEVVPVRLSDDLLSGTPGRPITSPSLAFPTTVAERGGRLFVVNSQLDRTTPELPFTVSGLPIPASARPR